MNLQRPLLNSHPDATPDTVVTINGAEVPAPAAGSLAMATRE